MEKIGIMGAGSVGLSLATILSYNHNVIVYDIDSDKVNLINIDDDIKFRATTNYREALSNTDFIIIALPTDYDSERGELNTNLIEDALIDIKYHCDSEDAIIVIKSTVPIGFTSKMRIKYKMDNIIYSPDFSREGSSLDDNLRPSRIVIGGNKKMGEKFISLFNDYYLGEGIPFKYMSSNEAEAVKLFSNAYLAMRVAFFNELDIYAEQHNLDPKKIIEGVSLDPRIGEYYNNPSFGYGGICFPKDVKQLGTSYDGIPHVLLDSIDKSNNYRIDYITNRIKSTRAKVVGIYRTNTKSGVDDIRNAAMMRILEKLKEKDLDIIVYESLLKDSVYGFEVTDNLEEFKKKSDLIVANRVDSNLDDVKTKVYTRDIFFRD